MALWSILLASLALARCSAVSSTVGPTLSPIGSPEISAEPSLPNDDEAIDEGLYSRQLCVAIRARSNVEVTHACVAGTFSDATRSARFRGLRSC